MKKKKLTNNIGLKIASVILAVLIWLVVLNVSDPDKTITISNIPITFINENAITGQDKVYEIASGKAATLKTLLLEPTQRAPRLKKVLLPKRELSVVSRVTC